MHSRTNHETISHLDKLNSDKHDWVIKVRVSRLWDVFDINNQADLPSTEMVLIDENVIVFLKHILSYFISIIF